VFIEVSSHRADEVSGLLEGVGGPVRREEQAPTAGAIHCTISQVTFSSCTHVPLTWGQVLSQPIFSIYPIVEQSKILLPNDGGGWRSAAKRRVQPSTLHRNLVQRARNGLVGRRNRSAVDGGATKPAVQLVGGETLPIVLINAGKKIQGPVYSAVSYRGSVPAN
jgi:hypothetical protein